MQIRKLIVTPLELQFHELQLSKFQKSNFTAHQGTMIRKKINQVHCNPYHSFLSAEERAREAESASRDLEKKISLKAKPRKEDRAALRGTQDTATAYRNLAQSKKEEANFKKKYAILN